MALTVLPENIPLELRQIPAWAVWRAEMDPGTSHMSKPPYQALHPEERAYATQPETWATFEQALDCYRARGWFDGISFAIAEEHGIVGVDLDHVSEHADDTLLIAHALESYTEWSPSGDGIRIFVRGMLPPGRRVRGWIEMYSDKRFLTVTGHRLDWASPTVDERADRLMTLHANFVEFG